LSAAKDDQLVLTSDGTIRWTGDAVARLVAADDVLHPRIRIISDERLAGAPREAVQARLELWLKTHIEKLLGPLFDLAKAEDITGIARGIAFQLIEALGVLERSKIATEMKDLDQPSRASLRKYGVRFGAYHIYVPALLKPAARALASLLWAQKQDAVEVSALSGAQHLAGTGRTSFPVDKSIDREAYRVLGYKQCGERAVRVDILERLADLIRPALSWRTGTPGTKPAGAFDGRSFVVTQAMTSLTGSAGEDFASILRALGYRMEQRPALPPEPAPVAVEAAPPEAAAVEAVAAEAGAETALAETPLAETPVEASAAPQVLDESGAVAESATTDAPAAVEAPAEAGAAVEAPAEAAAIEAVAAEAGAETVLAETPVETPGDTPQVLDESGATLPDGAVAPAPGESEQAAAREATADVAVAPSEVAAAAEMVEVWRPGGRPEERRPRHDRARPRHHDRAQPRPQEGAQPVAAASDAGEGAKRERHRRGRRERNKEFAKPRSDAPAEAASVAAEAAPAVPREESGRGPRERFQGKGREGRDKGKFAGKPKGEREGGRSGGGPSHRQYASSAPPRERERPVDPNSPFAKLAALKEQLTAGRKE
jgi:ATP-dependent RNA helicase SUPV3L1/SUV3